MWALVFIFVYLIEPQLLKVLFRSSVHWLRWGLTFLLWNCVFDSRSTTWFFSLKVLVDKDICTVFVNTHNFSSKQCPIHFFPDSFIKLLVTYSKTREFKKTQKVAFYRCIKAATMIELSTLYVVLSNSTK